MYTPRPFSSAETEQHQHKGNIQKALTNLLVFELYGYPDTPADEADTCPSAQTFMEGTRIRRGKAVRSKFQQQNRKCAEAVRSNLGLRPSRSFSSHWLGRRSFLPIPSPHLGWVVN